MLGTIIGGGQFVRDGQEHLGLTLFDLDGDRKSARFLPTGFLPHALAIDPVDTTRAAVFEKHGPGACYVDLAAGKLLARITSPAARHFYGHGAYDDEGRLYATESYLDDKHRGVLVVRDAKTLKELGTVPTFGTAPHDCLLLDDRRTMVVTNGGGPLRGGDAPSITYVDLKAHKLLERITLPAPRFNAGHVAVSGTGDLALVSAPRDGLPTKGTKLGAVSLKPQGAAIETMRKPAKVVKRMKGETLSVLIDETRDLVLATHPEGSMVSGWSMRDRKLVRRYDDFEEPRGICTTLDGAFYVVGHSSAGSVALSFIDVATGELQPQLRIRPSYISGSHIFAHALPTAA